MSQTLVFCETTALTEINILQCLFQSLILTNETVNYATQNNVDAPSVSCSQRKSLQLLKLHMG